MATLEIKDLKGKVIGKHEVSKKIVETEASMNTLHRTVVAEAANSRQGTQSAKTRAETNGGGRKPYKQKKTGNARQGSTRSPQWAHGSMALAVKPRDYDKKVNKKERRAALVGSLHAQIEAGNVTVVDKLVFGEPKTKSASDLLNALGVGEVRRVLVILPEFDANTYKSFRNLPNVVVRTAPVAQSSKKVEAATEEKKSKKAPKAPEVVKTNTFSTRDILVAHKIVVAKDALARIEEVWS